MTRSAHIRPHRSPSTRAARAGTARRRAGTAARRGRRCRRRRAPTGPSAARRSPSGSGRCAGARAAPSARGRSGSGPSRARIAVDLRARPAPRTRSGRAGRSTRRRRPGRRPPTASAGRPSRAGGVAGAAGERAVQPEVDVQGVAAEVGEQVLAVGEDLLEHPPVEQGGAGVEPPLRAGDVHRAPGERPLLLAGQAEQGVPLRHGRSSGFRAGHRTAPARSGRGRPAARRRARRSARGSRRRRRPGQQPGLVHVRGRGRRAAPAPTAARSRRPGRTAALAGRVEHPVVGRGVGAVPATHCQPWLLLARSPSTRCRRKCRAPRRQSRCRSFTRNDATIIRTRLCTYASPSSCRIPASTIG